MGINEIHLIISILGGSLGLIVVTAAVLCLLFYTKQQIDKKLKDIQEHVEDKTKTSFEKLDTDIKELKESVDTDIKDLKESVDKEIINIKEVVSEFKLINQKERSTVKDELHEKLDDTKKSLEDVMKQFVTTVTEIKQADKEMSVQFITMLNSVKDELKNDYTARYNDLLVLINSKANESDFNRLETKFDKFSETITELNTIVRLQLEPKKEHKKN